MTVSLLHPNEWDTFHKAAVLDALMRASEQGRATCHHQFSGSKSPIAMYRQVMEGHVPAAIADGSFLILYDYGPSILSDELALFEGIVIRLGKRPANLSAVPRALEQLARLHGCKSVVAGNSLGRHGLTRVYERGGFQPMSVQLIKEID